MSTVLIVDDAKTDQELMASVVVNAGHSVLIASSGAEAIELAKLHKPALIFLDVVMPVMDGFATCRNLSKDPDTANIPVVLVTSKSNDSDVFWGKKQGALGHIGKPYDVRMLEEAMRRYC